MEEIKENITTWVCGTSRFGVDWHFEGRGWGWGGGGGFTNFYSLQDKHFVKDFYSIL